LLSDITLKLLYKQLSLFYENTIPESVEYSTDKKSLDYIYSKTDFDIIEQIEKLIDDRIQTIIKNYKYTIRGAQNEQKKIENEFIYKG